jgi:mersacidin/lichenicidin family type 2 lantibiotic
MDSEQTIRAWKDEDYRLSLGEAELSALPEHPAGLIDLADDRLADASGGTTPAVAWALLIYGYDLAATHMFSCYDGCKPTAPLGNGGTC